MRNKDKYFRIQRILGIAWTLDHLVWAAVMWDVVFVMDAGATTPVVPSKQARMAKP